MLLGAIAFICVARHTFVHWAMTKSKHVAMPFDQSVSSFINRHCKYQVVNELAVDNIRKKNCKSKDLPRSFRLIQQRFFGRNTGLVGLNMPQFHLFTTYVQCLEPNEQNGHQKVDCIPKSQTQYCLCCKMSPKNQMQCQYLQKH